MRAAWRRLANAPFLKVEATKFTEVGYVGRDVDQIVRDLVEAGIAMTKAARRKDVEAQAQLNAERRVIEALVGANASETTREAFRRKLRSGELDDKEIEIQVADTGTEVSRFPACRAARQASSTCPTCWARPSAAAPRRGA